MTIDKPKRIPRKLKKTIIKNHSREVYQEIMNGAKIWMNNRPYILAEAYKTVIYNQYGEDVT